MDRFGNTYDSTTTTAFYSGLGESELDVIGRQLNTFLKQVTYPISGDIIMMESLTDEEYEAVADFLCDYRCRDKEMNEVLCRESDDTEAETDSPELPGQISMFD